MRKSILLFLCLFSFWASAQKRRSKEVITPRKKEMAKYTLEQAENSNDPKIIANFIINNPEHPKIPSLKQKVVHLTMPKGTENIKISDNAVKYKPKINVLSERKQSEDILNYLLNGNRKGNKSYIVVKNASRCDIVVRLKGITNYEINIPSGKMVDYW